MVYLGSSVRCLTVLQPHLLSQFLDYSHLSTTGLLHIVFSAWFFLPTFCWIHVYLQVLNFTFSRFALTSESLLNLSDIVSNVTFSATVDPSCAHITLHFASIALTIMYISIYATLS